MNAFASAAPSAEYLTQVLAAELLAAANPEWTWSGPRRELSLGSAHAAELQPHSCKWIAFSNGFLMMNGVVPLLFDSPRAAIEALGFTLAD